MKWDEAPFICKLFKMNKTDYPTKRFFFQFRYFYYLIYNKYLIFFLDNSQMTIG